MEADRSHRHDERDGDPDREKWISSLVVTMPMALNDNVIVDRTKWMSTGYGIIRTTTTIGIDERPRPSDVCNMSLHCHC